MNIFYILRYKVKSMKPSWEGAAGRFLRTMFESHVTNVETCIDWTSEEVRFQFFLAICIVCHPNSVTATVLLTDHLEDLS